MDFFDMIRNILNESKRVNMSEKIKHYKKLKKEIEDAKYKEITIDSNDLDYWEET